MKISPKHCKILSTCDLGTKILWQSSLWLLLAWSCGNAACKYQARRGQPATRGGEPWPCNDQEGNNGDEKEGSQVDCQQWGSRWKLMFNIHLSCWKRKFVQMQFGPFFMYIVENRGIKNSEAMEFVLLKWSMFWSIIWGKPSINGIKMGKWVRLTNIKYLIAFWTDLQPCQ